MIFATPRRLHALVLLLAIGLGFYLCYRLAVPFLPPLVWAGSMRGMRDMVFPLRVGGEGFAAAAGDQCLGLTRTIGHHSSAIHA